MGRNLLFRRWMAFNAVGALGVLLQLGLLALLVHAAHVHYLVATIVAVEATIVHNFAWHHRWTWKDRRAGSRLASVRRFGTFNVLNGGISLAGNALVMALLTGGLGVEPLVANVAAIVVCSIANFAASETLVFRSAGAAALGIVLIAPAPAVAGPGAETIKGWNAYASRIDARFVRASAQGPFFVLDEVGPRGWRDAVRKGIVQMSSVETDGLGGGKLHHWVGAIFVPGARVDDVVARLRASAGRESEFHDDVLASRLISQRGTGGVVYMKLRRESVITVTYNTEHAFEYRQVSGTRTVSRSEATKIAELAEAGTARERERAADDDHGFLWRLNAYWRYEQVDGGVIVECESVSLSRSIPLVLRPFVTSTVDRIARESLQKTLASVRSFLTRKGASAA